MKSNKLNLPKLFTTSTKSPNRDEIYPFTQQPSDNKFSTKPSNKASEAPSDLFSRFTADIIREEVIFTR